MDISNITLAQLASIAAAFSGEAKNENAPESIASDCINKYVIVRSRNEGINFGLLVRADETGCVIDYAQRLYYHKPKDSKTAWYEGVAETGLHSDSKISGQVSRKYIVEDYSLTICSEAAVKSIKNHEPTQS